MIGLLGLLVQVGCDPEPAAPTPLILLLSLDTTRADALGAYADVAHWGRGEASAPRPRTPRLDALAAAGTRFAWAMAHSPTTLSSHSSVMTGLDPHGHRVPRNGFPLPEGLPTLAERLGAAGYEGIGVVGASVLAAETGIGRGFATWDDAVSTRVRKRFEDPAAQVTARALAAVDRRARPGEPLLLFVHYFDAHSPWDSAPPALREGLVDPAYAGAIDGSGRSVDLLVGMSRQGVLGSADRRQARALYLAEVAAIDLAVGQLLDGLQVRGLLEESLVVAFGDHGETLDEVPARPYGHGLDVELVDIHVPLILRGTGRFALPAGRVDTRTVRLQDIGATVLSRAGLTGGLGEGWDLLGPGAPPPAFAEATKPAGQESQQGWNNLPFARAVVEGEGMLLRAPLLGPEARLVDRAPGQPLREDADRASALDTLLRDWDAAAPAYRPAPALSPEAEAGLRALGYLDP